MDRLYGWFIYYNSLRYGYHNMTIEENVPYKLFKKLECDYINMFNIFIRPTSKKPIVLTVNHIDRKIFTEK